MVIEVSYVERGAGSVTGRNQDFETRAIVSNRISMFWVDLPRSSRSAVFNLSSATAKSLTSVPWTFSGVIPASRSACFEAKISPRFVLKLSTNCCSASVGGAIGG